MDGTAGTARCHREKFRRDNGLDYARDEILVSSGAKQSCYNICIATLNAGDEAIVPAPYWVSYPDMIKLAEAEPVIIPASLKDGFKITPRSTGCRDHRQDPPDVPEQPVQPHRRGLYTGRAGRHWAKC